jgi:hypothetical protein
MSTMIEKVARALAEGDGCDYDRWSIMYDAQARAAIKAMRTPTDLMVDALMAAEGECRADPNIPYGAIFTAAIDAALNEQVDREKQG